MEGVRGGAGGGGRGQRDIITSHRASHERWVVDRGIVCGGWGRGEGRGGGVRQGPWQGALQCIMFLVIHPSLLLGLPQPPAPQMSSRLDPSYPPICPHPPGAPWWSWLGGPLGAFFIISLIVFAPRIGAGNVIAVFVCLQIASAVTLDLIGAVGYVRRTFSWPRWVGVALMGAGVALITRFPGEPVDKGPVLGTGARTPVGRALTHLFTRLPQFATAVSAAEGAGAGEVVLGPLPPGQHNHRA